MTRIHAILLAGGTGQRMGSPIPKQYLLLQNQPISLYSAKILERMPDMESLTIVCAPEFQSLFQDALLKIPLQFAQPGKRRQDSLENGLLTLSQDGLVVVHDAARPLVTTTLIQKVLKTAQEKGAAAAALPVKGTIRRSGADGLAVQTLDRSSLWEMQTPQIAPLSWLKKGLVIAKERKREITDELEILELAQYPSYLVLGEEQNFKITTPADLSLAEAWLSRCTTIS